MSPAVRQAERAYPTDHDRCGGLPKPITAPCGSLTQLAAPRNYWGKLDFVVHSIAFSPKDALQGRVVDVSRDGFLTTMDVSCWTFIRMAHLAEPLMRKGGTLFTMTYYGSQMVV